jgi:predicted acyltransferase
MVAEVLHLCRVAANFPDSKVWAWLCHNQSHVPWVGCSIHDMIQPSFSFMVGVALPFSLAARRAKGQSTGRMTLHAWWRAAVLVALGIFLRSQGSGQTNFTFEDTLTQIGLGYGFLFMIGQRSLWVQWSALVLVLVGYWIAFAAYPLPAVDFDYKTIGVENDWPHLAEGFAAHWNKNTNAAHHFDVWFLNLFPRETPFAYNGGGYLTLSFIPTLGTMILGLLAGGMLRDQTRPTAKLVRLCVLGVAGLALGWTLDHFGVCPNVKRIWTPAFALFSGGWCFLNMAALYCVIDVWRLRAWAFPLVVIGMNSIAIYVMAGTIEGYVGAALSRHLPDDLFHAFGDAYEPLVHGAGVILVFWLILYWMYRRKIFLRI